MFVKMKDIYGTEVEIQESRSGYFRMDFSGEWFPGRVDPVTNGTINACVSFDVDKARVIQAALNEYFDEQ